MKVLNRVKEFADSRGLTAYALWKQTVLSEPTVYRLYNNPQFIPSGKVLQGFAEAFPDSTPNDWLKFEKKKTKRGTKASKQAKEEEEDEKD
ncbi:MAG: helix-turn-helix transcriptional regulator [Cyanobacteria bacterium SBLK]|nr:helix-turn-helix transcriptional regulator [Cyanobacteria bacterium SBLK]